MVCELVLNKLLTEMFLLYTYYMPWFLVVIVHMNKTQSLPSICIYITIT